MVPVEEIAARGWPAAEALRRDGWLLRYTPSLTRRRSNSALPLADHPDPALVEDFYARRGARALVQVSPAEERAGLDAELARRGGRAKGRPTSSSPTPTPCWRRRRPMRWWRRRPAQCWRRRHPA